MNIKALRLLANLTQSELAARLGISRTAVVAWEKGASSPPAAKLPKLAKIFNCTIDELFSESEDDAKS